MAKKQKIHPNVFIFHNWVIILFAALASFWMTVFLEDGSAKQIADPDIRVGYIIGTGFGIALAIWLAAYILVLRKANKLEKWFSFFLVASSGILASYSTSF